jgi:hypothetical protein
MKKLILMLIVIVLVGCASREPDFRSARWGMKKKQIIAIEGDPLEQHNDWLLRYVGHMNGKECDIEFVFVQNKLYHGAYFFVYKDNPYDVLPEYVELIRLLEKKYGTTTMDTVWTHSFSEKYKSNPDNWGISLITGKLISRCSWTTERTKIFLKPFRSGRIMKLAVVYITNPSCGIPSYLVLD